jgi:hypothetical protein
MQDIATLAATLVAHAAQILAFIPATIVPPIW